METSSTSSSSVVTSSSVISLLSSGFIGPPSYPLVCPFSDGGANVRQFSMDELDDAPGRRAPLPVGTALRYDDSLEFLSDDLIAGGHPWKVTRLRGPSGTTLRRWGETGLVGPGEGALARTLIDQGYVHPHFTTGIERSDIDVVIPVFGDLDGLRRLLPALEGWAVTVVDDASPQPSAIREICDSYGATYVARDTNGGPGAARNTGAAVKIGRAHV